MWGVGYRGEEGVDVYVGRCAGRSRVKLMQQAGGQLCCKQVTPCLTIDMEVAGVA